MAAIESTYDPSSFSEPLQSTEWVVKEHHARILVERDFPTTTAKLADIGGTVTFAIKLMTPWVGDYNEERFPVSALNGEERSHIHAQLTVLVAGRELPRMGFWGQDDVCLNDWIKVLSRLRLLSLGHSDAAVLHDGGEPGQPAFLFEREGEKILVSVIDSKIFGGTGEVDFQRLVCQASDVSLSCEKTLAELQKLLEQDLGQQRAQAFLKACLEN